MPAVKFDKVLDARGLACPMPIVRARQAINALPPGSVPTGFGPRQGWDMAGQ